MTARLTQRSDSSGTSLFGYTKGQADQRHRRFLGGAGRPDLRQCGVAVHDRLRCRPGTDLRLRRVRAAGQ
ncbi:hypothetical protein G5V59_09760 [Nocardioides sp. W3-2-3]|uniref:hypothetical protein n=1 Tax=Nocardioides convexus TaxID=2712224 RepID=UPI002418A26E|nr:hypothetical protein [Nocardioides convexus]NHA00294.1 hypothetical protein [Nocardioides convexus]